jgi:hypothetical protein
MKKKFLWGLLALALVYTCVWFAVSYVLEGKVYGYLDKLKQEKTISEYSGNIHITGFPFSFNLNLSHPRVKFQKQDSGVNANCDMLFDGVLSMEFGFFSDKINIQPIGDLHLKGNLNRYEFNSTIGGKNSHYQIWLTNSLILSALKGSIGASGKTMKDLVAALINKISIHNEELSMVNKLTNNLLIYADEIDLKINVKGGRNNLNVRYMENLSNAEFHNEFNVLTSEILSLGFVKEITNNIDINVRNYLDVFSFDKLGKINHKIDLQVNMSNDVVSVKLHKLLLKDAAYDIDTTGTVVLGGKDKFDLEFESKFSSKWYELMKIYANRLYIKNLDKKPFGSSNNSIVSNVLNAIFGFFTNMFSSNSARPAYVPKLHEMGVIKGDIDVTYAKLGKGFDLDIDTFQVNTDRFTIDASGSADNAGRGGGDRYDMKANITHYPYVVNELVAYVNRVSEASGRSLFVLGKTLVISKNVSDRIKFFLKEVSDDPLSTSDSLKLTIVNKDGGECPSVGKYSNKEFCAAWKGFVFNLLLGEIARNLNPEEMSKMLLKAPSNIVEKLPGQAGKVAKDIMGIFGLNKTK